MGHIQGTCSWDKCMKDHLPLAAKPTTTCNRIKGDMQPNQESHVTKPRATCSQTKAACSQIMGHMQPRAHTMYSHSKGRIDLNYGSHAATRTGLPLKQHPLWRLCP